MALTDTIRTRAKRTTTAADPTVTIDEVAAVGGVADFVVLDAAAEAGVDVVLDWADRPAVTPADARTLVQTVRNRPPAPPVTNVTPASAAFVPPPVFDARSGRFVPAISRPGEEQPSALGGF